MSTRLSATRILTAADTTKLDGIEALADVTDATNVAAAGAVMDGDFAGTTLGRMTRTGAGTYSVVQDNLAAAVGPTVNDDGTANYGVGSLWYDTTADVLYSCIDSSTGAAVWVRVVNATTLTTTGDILAASATSTPTRIAAGGAGTVLVGNGAGVLPSFQAVAGLAVDVLDAVIAVADAGGGGTTSACTVALQDLAAAPVARVGVVKILGQDTEYAGVHDVNGNVTFSLATAGAILASGNGWAIVSTDATGNFACTVTNAADETVWFSVCTADGGHDTLAHGVIIRGCVPDDATWSA